MINKVATRNRTEHIQEAPGFMHAAGSFTISLNRDFPFGLSLEPLQAYFAPHLNIARPPPRLAPGGFSGIFLPLRRFEAPLGRVKRA